jgi:ornithine carrier protein
MAENATLFLAYGELQNVIRQVGNIPVTQALSLPQLTLAAAGAGAITSFVLYVFFSLHRELLRVLMV